MAEQAQFAGLEDLEAMDGAVVACRITLPDGKIKRFKLGVLSYSDYNEIVLDVPEPTPPTRVVAGARVPWPDAPSMKTARATTQGERQRRLLAASLEAGGMTLPGNDLAAKADWVNARGTAIVSALLIGFTQAHHGLGGRLESLSETFLSLPDSEIEGTPELEADGG